jgi:hypothetical protein
VAPHAVVICSSRVLGRDPAKLKPRPSERGFLCAVTATSRRAASVRGGVHDGGGAVLGGIGALVTVRIYSEAFSYSPEDFRCGSCCKPWSSSR